jgi:hypothetical protein
MKCGKGEEEGGRAGSLAGGIAVTDRASRRPACSRVGLRWRRKSLVKKGSRARSGSCWRGRRYGRQYGVRRRRAAAGRRAQRAAPSVCVVQKTERRRGWMGRKRCASCAVGLGYAERITGLGWASFPVLMSFPLSFFFTLLLILYFTFLIIFSGY